MNVETDEIADRLHSAAIHLLRRAREHDEESGLSPARLSALSVVVFRGPLTLGKLAAAEDVRSATMTGIVNGLEKDRLVRRKPHAQDRRAVLVEATSAGRRRLAQARARRIDLVAGKVADLSEADLALLKRAAELLDERFALQPWKPVELRSGGASQPSSTGYRASPARQLAAKSATPASPVQSA